MNNSQIVRLRTDVLLIPVAIEHANAMYRWMQDPDISTNIGLHNKPSLDRTTQWITNVIDDRTVLARAIILNGNHVGNVVLDHNDIYLATARLSIYIGEPKARQGGVGTTAIHALLREGFQERSLYKVWLTVHINNTVAIKTYMRVGFMLEGILRDEFILNSKRVSLLYMGITRSDFQHLETSDL